jgi:hypothetical protein
MVPVRTVMPVRAVMHEQTASPFGLIRRANRGGRPRAAVASRQMLITILEGRPGLC